MPHKNLHMRYAYQHFYSRRLVKKPSIAEQLVLFDDAIAILDTVSSNEVINEVNRIIAMHERLLDNLNIIKRCVQESKE